MAQQSILDLAKQGQPKAIAALLVKPLGNQAKIQAGLRDGVLVVRAISDHPLSQSETITLIETVLIRIACPKIQSCIVESYPTNSTELRWSDSISLMASAEELLDIPNLADDYEAIATETPVKGGWKLPGVNLNSLQKMSGQVADQALKIAQDTATTTHGAAFKATEQALRTSIDQTMNAFQLAVEQIHARKLPAKMAALTGTVNVGVIQLSIRLDIPMDEETGEIAVDMK